MSDLDYTGNERRHSNIQIMPLLANMDKNIALLAQSSKTTNDTLVAHVEEDKDIQKESIKTNEKLVSRIEKVENKLAWYAGAIAIIFGGIELASKFLPVVQAATN